MLAFPSPCSAPPWQHLCFPSTELGSQSIQTSLKASQNCAGEGHCGPACCPVGPAVPVLSWDCPPIWGKPAPSSSGLGLKCGSHSITGEAEDTPFHPFWPIWQMLLPFTDQRGNGWWRRWSWLLRLPTHGLCGLRILDWTEFVVSLLRGRTRPFFYQQMLVMSSLVS